MRHEECLLTIFWFSVYQSVHGEVGVFKVDGWPVRGNIDVEALGLTGELVASGFLTGVDWDGPFALTRKGAERGRSYMDAKNLEEQLREPYPTTRAEVMAELDSSSIPAELCEPVISRISR